MQGITITLTADEKLTSLLERLINALEKQSNPTLMEPVKALDTPNTPVLEAPKNDDPKMEVTKNDAAIQAAYESLVEAEKELEEAEKKKAKSLTLTEVRKVVIDTGLSKSPNKLSSALNKFGACKLSEVNPTEYKAFVDYIKEMTV